MKFQFISSITIIAALVWVSCGNSETNSDNDNSDSPLTEATTDAADLLVGNWTLAEARRSGTTADIGDFFLTFTADHTFKSDLFDENQAKPYLDGVKAIVEDDNISFETLPQNYVIEQVSDSMLVLSIELKNFPFELTFKKVPSMPE